MANLNIVYFPVGDLHPFSKNARTHTKKQIRQIAESILKFGFTNPVLIDAGKTILAGHGRVEAAKLIGMNEVPTVRLDLMSEAEKRAYILADNKIAENAGWDREILALELQHLCDLDLDFDISVTGFETPEIDILIEGAHPHAPEEEVLNFPLPGETVSQLGDLWVLGEHKVFCGNALLRDSFETLMEKERAQVIFTDPPYNVPINGHVSGKGTVKHREFTMATGEMSQVEFSSFLKTAFNNLKAFSQEGALHFICMDWRHINEIMAAGSEVYSGLINLCVWNKTNGGMGSLYRSKHELVFVFKKGAAPHINNVDLGRHGRNRTNVWDYPGVNSFHRGRGEELKMHPTVKPVEMIKDAILDCSNRKEIVLDCFGGSGSSLIAAHRAGRRCRLMELDPVYVDVILDRFTNETGIEAFHQQTGLRFAQVKRRRLGIQNSKEVGAPSHVK